MLFLQVNRRMATCASVDKLTSGSVGIPVRFEFSEDWDGLAKVAIFCAGKQQVDVYLAEDCCTVPPELLAMPGEELTIGVYGADGTGTVVIPTIYAAAGCIVQGAAPSGIEPTPQTQPLINQILAAAEEALEIARSVRKDADNGVFNGADYILTALDKTEIAQVVLSYMVNAEKEAM